MAERRFGRRIPLPSVIAIKHQIRIVMELERSGLIRKSPRKLAAKKQNPPK